MEQMTQKDLDNLADIIWWIKGYIAGCDKNLELSPFGVDHIESLRKSRIKIQELINEKASQVPKP